ncbi:MAG: response regulator [Bacteroidota bacterium]
MAGILLVEDNDDLRMMLKSALEKRRHVVVEASNGREALNKFKQSLDIVVTDILMPEQDGIGLIMEVKKLKPEIRIIAISGGGKISPSSYLDLAKTLGADAVFSKPFELKSFISEVERIVAG